MLPPRRRGRARSCRRTRGRSCQSRRSPTRASSRSACGHRPDLAQEAASWAAIGLATSLPRVARPPSRLPSSPCLQRYTDDWIVPMRGWARRLASREGGEARGRAGLSAGVASALDRLAHRKGGGQPVGSHVGAHVPQRGDEHQPGDPPCPGGGGGVARRRSSLAADVARRVDRGDARGVAAVTVDGSLLTGFTAWQALPPEERQNRG